MKWERSTFVERFLESQGIPYHWQEGIPFSTINRKKGLQNNVDKDLPLEQRVARARRRCVLNRIYWMIVSKELERRGEKGNYEYRLKTA